MVCRKICKISSNCTTLHEYSRFADHRRIYFLIFQMLIVEMTCSWFSKGKRKKNQKIQFLRVSKVHSPRKICTCKVSRMLHQVRKLSVINPRYDEHASQAPDWRQSVIAFLVTCGYILVELRRIICSQCTIAFIQLALDVDRRF